MKNKTYSWLVDHYPLSILGAMVAIAAFVVTHPAQVRSAIRTPQVLVLQGTQDYARTDAGFTYPDIMVHCASASDPAAKPVLPRFGADGYPDQYVPIAIALANAKSAGYRITWHDNLTFVLERD